MDKVTEANKALKEGGYKSRIVGYSDLGAFYTYFDGEDEHAVQRIVQGVIYRKDTYTVYISINYTGKVEASSQEEADTLALHAALLDRHTRTSVEIDNE